MEYELPDHQSKYLAYLQEHTEPRIKQTHLGSPMTRCNIHEIEPYFADAIQNMQNQIKMLEHSISTPDLER